MHDGDTISTDLRDLKVISVLGRGAKGVVFLVQTETGEVLALKAVLRSSIEKKKSTGHGKECRRVWFERQVLSSFNHPLLPKLHGVLITDKIVGYAIDYCPGRDLNCLRRKQTEKMFSDDIIRFYAAELVLALEYLHNIGIVYRDLKPENVMIQQDGHLMLVDFDLSTKLSAKSPEPRSLPSSQSKPHMRPKKKNRFTCFSNCRDLGILPEDPVHLGGESPSSFESDSVEKSNSFVGTEEYLAPEVILANGHDFSVDWWCLGIMLYEMLYGATPFRAVNRNETFHRVITKEPNLTGEWTPLRDLIGKLLEKDPKKRIAVKEIKGHDFFKAVDWDTITEMPRPPFLPELTEIEGMKGNKEIDMESFVQGVFEIGEEDGKSENSTCEEIRNRDGWVKLNNHPTQIRNDNFFIF